MFLVIRYAVIKMQALARGHKVSVKKIKTKWKFKVTGGEDVHQILVKCSVKLNIVDMLFKFI